MLIIVMTNYLFHIIINIFTPILMDKVVTAHIISTFLIKYYFFTICVISPTVANINKGSYKISRPFNIAVKENISAVAQDFVNYIVSEEGQKIIAANKYIKIQNIKSYASSKATGKVVVAGSSSVSPVMEKLIESYKSINPNAKIELQTSDSTTGVTNAISGTCDIGMASRGLKDSEKSKGVKEITIAVDGIAVVVNRENPADGLTKSQVEQIFTGKITKWNNVK